MLREASGVSPRDGDLPSVRVLIGTQHVGRCMSAESNSSFVELVPVLYPLSDIKA